MGFKIFKAPPFLLEKINELCDLLWQGKREYEQVSAIIPDKELRRTILTLAQESNQYACELSSQIQILGGALQKQKIYLSEPKLNINVFHDENDILSFCKMIEKKMVKAYHEILNESHLYEGLRSLIHYQLNGILYAFMQLKLLNSVRLH